jgi:signal transduction histidine kinase
VSQKDLERLAAMGTMVAGFAHEVRNPLAAMRSITEQLREELHEAGTEPPHIGVLLGLIARVERLVRTSLQFGRPAAPKRARRKPAAIAHTALSDLRINRLAGAAVDVRLEADGPTSDVRVDDGQLVQALVILLDNAIDSTGDSSRVLLRVREGRPPDVQPRRSDPHLHTHVRFEVIDDGPGIPPEVIQRIFDPFFTTKPTGTGLGLSIAQHLVNENGGRLEVASVAGGPTCFSIVVSALPPAGSDS